MFKENYNFKKPDRQKLHKLFFYLFAIPLLVIMVFAVSCKKENSSAETIKAVRNTISEVVNTTGNVDSSEYKNLSLPVGGKVIRSVKKGDELKKGQVLIEIDSERTSLLISQSENSISLAENSLKLAELNYQNALDANHIAVQLAENNNELAAASVNAALVALENANNVGSSSIASAKTALDNAQNSYAQTVNQAKTAVEQAEYQLKTAKDNGLTGTMLAQYESAVANAKASYSSTVAAAEISINSAASSISQAEATARSASENAQEAYNQALLNQSLAYWNSLANLEQAQNQIKITLENIESAKIQVDNARISLGVAKLDLENTVIKMPFDGIVQNINFTESEYLTPGVSAVTVMQDKLVIKTNIEESDIAKIKEGQKTEISLDAFSGRLFTGEVKEISKVSTNLAGVITFPVTIEIEDDARELMMHGMSANITIFISQKKDILTVPSISVFEENGRNYVYLVDQSSTYGYSIRDVKTGISDFENTEIVSGLDEGEEIFLTRPESEKINIFLRNRNNK